jgi:site-specific recombinase
LGYSLDAVALLLEHRAAVGVLEVLPAALLALFLALRARRSYIGSKDQVKDTIYTYRRLRVSVVVPPDGPSDVSCELMLNLNLSKKEATPASGANSSARP